MTLVLNTDVITRVAFTNGGKDELTLNTGITDGLKGIPLVLNTCELLMVSFTETD